MRTEVRTGREAAKKVACPFASDEDEVGQRVKRVQKGVKGK